MSARRTPRLAAAVLLLSLGLCGCNDDPNAWRRRLRPLPPEPKPPAAAKDDPVLAGTIGKRALLGSAEPLVLRGYGLVVGLGENGGSDCPTAIREYLLEYLQKEFASRERQDPLAGISPGKLIDSLDTAVVVVYGSVPAGAPRGTLFDARVEALGNQTRSLEGGVLLPTELKLFEADASGRGLVAGRTLARARGVVFTNPFRNPDQPAATRNVRVGLLLGGARTLEERTLRLMLVEPSYSLARQMERRINERFGQDPPAAEAMSQGYLTLHTPPAYAARPARFVELVTHLYEESTPTYYERKLRDLAEQIGKPGASYAHMSLAWEGMGRVAIPSLQPLYQHDDPGVSFHAARAGLRLADITALPVMANIAASASHPFRLLAVRELGQCGLPQAAARLAPLLDSSDQEIRIAAYEEMLNYAHPRIRSRRFVHRLDPTQTNFMLDVVSSTGRPLIYIRRTREPRIAVFGERVPVSRPMFYSRPDERAYINAPARTDSLTVFGVMQPGRRVSDKLTVNPTVDELIAALAAPPLPVGEGRLSGIGLDYAMVIEVLDTLCRETTVPARLVMEQPTLTEVLGPAPERPEADEPTAPTSRPAGP